MKPLPYGAFPFVRLLIPLLVGRVLGLYITTSAYVISSFVVIVALTIIYLYFKLEKKYAKRWIAGILINFSLVFAGLCSNVSGNVAHIQFDTTATYKGVVLNVFKEDIKKQNIELLVTKAESNKSVYFKSLLYLKKDSLQVPLLPGDQILFKSKLTKVKSESNPYAFDYSKYLNAKNIYGCFYLSSDQYIQLESGFSVRRYFYMIRNCFENKILNLDFDDEVSSILIALIFGDKTQIDNGVKGDFSGAGLMHLISVSGMHVGIIYLLIIFLLGGFKSKVNKKIQLVILLGCLWFYAGLTGMSPSVFRATIMFSIFIVTKSLSRVSYNIYHSLAIAAFIILLLNPEAIINVGFWLSFMAVISIVYFYPRINTIIYLTKPWSKFIWSLLSLSIAAQIGTAPLVIYAFGYFPLWFLISNIIIVPFIPFAFLGGLLLVFIPEHSLISQLLLGALNDLVLFVIEVAGWVNSFYLSKYAGLQLNIFEVFILYVIILFIILYNNIKSFINVTGGLVSTILFFILQTVTSYIQLSEERIVVHEIKGKSAISEIILNNSCFYSGSKISDLELERKVMPLWRSKLLTILEPHRVIADTIIPFYNSNYHGVILNGDMDLDALKKLQLNLDVIIITHKVSQNIIAEVLSEFKTAKVVFDSSFSQYECRQIADYQRNDSVVIHFVALNGAIVL